MLVERAEIIVREGEEDRFATGMGGRGVAILTAQDGVMAVSFGRGIENPSKFMLLITWATMDAHMAFTKAVIFDEFRGLISPFSTGGAMEHFEMT